MAADTNDGSMSELTINATAENGDWLEMAAREYGMSLDAAGNELLRYGLIHHEEAIGH